MQVINRMFCLFVLFFLAQTSFAANSPEGYWKTIDDVTGKPQSIMHIWIAPNKVLYGRLATIYPERPSDLNEVCTACRGERHNQRILGMVIMEGMRQSKDNPNEWRGGKIIDPKSGKSYHFYITVIDNGAKLNARGYVGLPLFGRTQTWIRVAGPNN